MQPEDSGSPVDLRDYLSVLNRRKWAVAGIALFCMVWSLATALRQEPVYASTAALLLRPSLSEEILTIDPDRQQLDRNRAVATEIEVITSSEVRRLVEERVGGPTSVRIGQRGNTDVVSIVGESTDPQRAADTANAYAEIYIEYSRTKDIDELATAIGSLTERIDDTRQRLDEIDAQIAAAPATTRQRVEQQLESERQSLEARLSGLENEVERLRLDTNIRRGGAEIVTPASVPSAPVRPQPRRSALIGLLGGLIVGVALAFLWDGLENPLRAEADLRKIAGDLPVLALIPKSPRRRRDRDTPFLPTHHDPTSPVAEAYRTLRTALTFAGATKSIRAVAITSPLAGEGKTSTAANVAVAFAQAGFRVIVVSCDLRRPSLHLQFGLNNQIGLSQVLSGMNPLGEAVQRVPDIPNLRVIASGAHVSNPSELLGSEAAVEALASLRANAHVVILDCPPVLPVTDAVVLSGLVDAVVLQSSASRTTRRQLSRALEVLRLAGAPLRGTVLNEVEQRTYSYGYATEYYNGSQQYDPDAADNGQRTTSSGDLQRAGEVGIYRAE